MKFVYFFTLLILCFSSLAEVLKPDEIKEHCYAFGGKWTRPCLKINSRGVCLKWGQYICKERLEFQQKPVTQNDSPTTEEEKKFCEEERQGRWTLNSYTEAEIRLMAANGLTGEEKFHVCLNAKSAQGLTRYPSKDASEIADRVETECIKKWDWSQRLCTVADSKVVGNWYDYTNEGNLMRVLGKPVMGLWGSVMNIANLVNDDYNRLRVHSIIKDASKELSACQKACLVKCASSKVITYSNKKTSKLQSLNSLYNTNEGVCTEFARVCSDIAPNADVYTSLSTGVGHAFNSFFIDGEWYYGEPQNDNCEFYHTQNSLEKYKEVYAIENQVYDGGRVPIRNLDEETSETLDSSSQNR